MKNGSHAATKARLLAAAAELFAQKGFHGTTVRDIAERAKVNVAAGNYHYGSKKDLYLEVLSEKFALIKQQIEATGSAVRPGAFDGLKRPQLLRLLRARLGVMVEMFAGGDNNLHAQLMMREAADPSEALPVIVSELINPLVDDSREIVRRLRPELSRRQVDNVVFSMTGQVQFYRFMMPLLLRMLGLESYSKKFLREIADHVFEFSIGGMDRIAAASRKGKA